MADTKISDLPTADPLDGTELILLSQDGADAQTDLATLRDDLAQYVTLKRPMVWPGIVLEQSTGTSLAQLTSLTSAGHYQAIVLQALEDMVVSHVGFRCNAAAGSPTGDFRIETVDNTTGLPSGTLWGTNTNGATGTIVANTNVLTALTAPATIPRGSVFALKIELATGTSFGVAHITQIRQIGSSGFPYNVANTGTPTKSSLTGTSCFALGSSSTVFYAVPGLMPVSALASSTYNNTNGARRGLRFTAPFSGRLIGLRTTPAAAGNVNAIVFNDAGTELSNSSTAFDIDNTASGGQVSFYLDNPVTVVRGTTYRVVLEPSSATNTGFTIATLPTSDYRSASPFGTDGHYTTYASAAWDDTNTTIVPVMDLLFDQIKR